ncbi:hypothetical protein ACLOJK_007832 [Asimina triloba]
MEAKENCEEKEDFQCSLGKNVQLVGRNGLVFPASKLRMILERAIMEQLIYKVKQPRTNQRCLMESGLQNHHGGKCQNSKYSSLVRLDENFVRCCLDLMEVKASDPLSIICRTSPYNIPVGIGSSKLEFLLSSFKPHRRRSRSTSDLGNFVFESALGAGQENLIIGPVGQWAIDRMIGNNKISSPWRSPFVRHLGAVDSNSSLGGEFFGLHDMKCSESIKSHSLQSVSSPKKQISETIGRGREKYGPNRSNKMTISCTSSSSTSSYQSMPSTGSTASVGLLHCKWESGLPHFMFSLDEQGEVYVANPYQVESLNNKGLDYVYLFHLRKDGKRNRGSSVSDASNLVGRMGVSNSLTVSSNNSKVAETEFVLFGVDEDHPEELRSAVNAPKSKKLAKKGVDAFRFNHSSKQKSTHLFGYASPKPKHLFHVSHMDVLGNLDEIGKENLADGHLPPNLELAAILVKDHSIDNSEKEAIGGWGLKFLQKAADKYPNRAQKSSGSFQDGCLGNGIESVKSLNVLVPAGVHGGPRTRTAGPSSLIERWRSGGCCDCGGWDVGCPLTVLHDQPSNTENFGESEAQENCKSFDLFMEMQVIV